MTYQAKPTFPRRRNLDGVIDSICRECLLTVASATVEEELTQREQSHVCSQLRLHQLRADRARYARLNCSQGFQ